jgi:hypothetical protein
MKSQDIVTAIGVMKVIMKDSYDTNIRDYKQQPRAWQVSADAISLLQSAITDVAYAEVNNVQ